MHYDIYLCDPRPNETCDREYVGSLNAPGFYAAIRQAVERWGGKAQRMDRVLEAVPASDPDSPSDGM